MNKRKLSAAATATPVQAAPPAAPFGGVVIVREHGRKAITGLSRPQWYRLEQAGKAPRRVKLTPDGVAHGWPLHELQAWVAARIAERDAS